ncbi:MAG: PQQ-dependent sugar dehydrogenase [Dehalococcoidia bacterium]
MSRSPVRLALALTVLVVAAVVAAVAAVAIDRSLDDGGAVVETLGAAVQPMPQATGIRRDPPVIFEGLPAGYRIENLVSGLEAPAALDGAPDGRIFFVEQVSGRVRVIENGALRAAPYYVVPDLYVQTSEAFVSELGLVGVTVDPNTDEGVAVYIYYSAQSSAGVRTTKLVRLRDERGAGVDPQTILEVAAAPECCHIAGSLTWLPDGTLLVGVGDHETPDAAQDVASPLGKLLRIDRNGGAPADNPFTGREGADPRVYAVGLRNAFGVAVDPQGPMFVLDNGEFGFDTIHRLEAGANYGWPASAVDEASEVATPLLTYLESNGLAGAIAYRDGPLTAFDGMVLFCQFHRGGALHRFAPQPARLQADDVILAPGCSSGIRQFADGYVYFLDYVNGALLRIADEDAPPLRTR